MLVVAVAAEAAAGRRADRVRQMTWACEIILLGLDDEETLILAGWDPDRYLAAPGLRMPARRSP